MAQQNTDFGQVADDLRRAAGSFALLTSQATLFGASLQAFREFEQQLVLTNAIAQGTVAQLEQMKTAARDFSLVTTVSAQQAGVALQQLAQAGFSAQQSLNAMNGVLLLSQATMTDVAVTSDLLSSNIRAFGLATTDAMRVSNVFAATVTGSLATMEKLAYAMRQVAPVAELANLSIEETSASLGVLFNIGLRGEQAGTALRNIIIRLVRPMGEASAVLRDAGVATRTATGEFRNLTEILTDLANSDLTDREFARIFETEALAGAKAFMKALTTINEDGVSQYEDLKRAVTGTDRAVELAAKNLDTLDGQLKLLNNSWVDFQRTLGEAIAPLVLEFAQGVRDLLQSFRDLDPAVQQSLARWIAFGVAMTGFLAAANALILLAKGPLLASIAGFTAATIKATVAQTSFNASLAAGLTRIGGIIGPIRNFAASMALVSAGSTGVAASFFGFLAAAAPVAAGLAVIAAAAGALALAFDATFYSAKELEHDLSGLDLDPGLKADAKEIADGIIPPGTAQEINKRIEDINSAFLLLSNPLDRIGYAGRAQTRLGYEHDDIIDQLVEIAKQDEEVFAYLQKEFALDKAIESWEEENGKLSRFADGATGFISGLGGVRTRFRKGLEYQFNQLTEEQQATAIALREGFTGLENGRRAVLESVAEFAKDEPKEIEKFLKQLSRGEDVAGEQYAHIVELIARKGYLDATEIRKAIAQELASGEGDVSLEDILRKVLTDRSGLDVDEIEAILSVNEEETNRALLSALDDLNEGLEVDLSKMRASLLKQRVDRASSIADAMAAAEELGVINLRNRLDAVAGSQRDKFAEVLTDFGIGGQLSPFAQIDSIVSSPTTDIPPEIAEAISPQALFDEVFALAESGMSAVDVRRKAEELGAVYEKDVQKYVETLADSNAISEDHASSLILSAQQSAGLIADLASQGIDIISENPDLIEVLSGSAFSDALKSRINENTTQEEAEQIIAEESAKYAKIIDSLITRIAASIEKITPEQLAELSDAGDNAMERITLEAIESVSDNGANIAKIEAALQKQIDAFAEIGQNLDVNLAASRQKMLEAQLKNAETLEEALVLGSQIAEAKMEASIGKYSERQTDVFKRAFESNGIDTAAIEGLFSEFAAEYGDTFENLPADFLTLLSGEALTDAINGQIDENTSQAEAEKIIAEQVAMYQEIMLLFVTMLKEAAVVDEAVLEQIKNSVAGTVANAQAKFLEGLDGKEADIDAIRERFERKETQRQRDEERAAKDALRRARSLEDAWTDVRKSMRDAQRGLYESSRGLTMDERMQFSRDLDLQSIIAEADEQIRDLNRAFEDLQIEFADNPQALAGLREEYDQLISIIEMEKQANIAAADSFTAQMERRSAAIELYQRDLRDISIASGNTFDQVSAGIASGFAEYQKDLVTIVDITQDAVTGVAEAFSTLVGDLIFDGENAWENFKKNILNISRQIVEAFTKSFIQQLMSSISGGGGSIFGNALQPSKALRGDPRNSQYPSVGTKGIFGMLFGGGQNTSQNTANTPEAAAAAQMGAAANRMDTSMTTMTGKLTTATERQITALNQLTQTLRACHGMAGGGAGYAPGAGGYSAGSMGMPGMVELTPDMYHLVASDRHPASGILGAWVNPEMYPGLSGGGSRGNTRVSSSGGGNVSIPAADVLNSAGQTMATSSAEMSRATQQFSSTADGWLTDVQFHLGPKRPGKPRPEVVQALDLAAYETFPNQDVTLDIVSGMGEHGSARHRPGYAADYDLYVDGVKIKNNSPEMLAFQQNLRGYGMTGYGASDGKGNYMGPYRVHNDWYPTELYTSNMGPYWGGTRQGPAVMGAPVDHPIEFWTDYNRGYSPGEGWGPDGMPLQWSGLYDQFRTEADGASAALERFSTSNMTAANAVGQFSDMFPTNPSDLAIVGGSKTASAAGSFSESNLLHSFGNRSHAGDNDYEDYSQMFREFTFQPKDGYIEVGNRGGAPVFAAPQPEFFVDGSGNLVPVDRNLYSQMVAQRDALIPTTAELESLYSQIDGVPFRGQNIYDPSRADYVGPLGNVGAAAANLEQYGFTNTGSGPAFYGPKEFASMGEVDAAVASLGKFSTEATAAAEAMTPFAGLNTPLQNNNQYNLPTGVTDTRELLARTLAAEAGAEHYEGMLGAGATIMNRAAADLDHWGGGVGAAGTIEGVILQPGHFSAWNAITGYRNGDGANNIVYETPSAEAYRAADDLLSGNYVDPTFGADHYYDPDTANPPWGRRDRGGWTDLAEFGGHVFGTANGRSPASATMEQLTANLNDAGIQINSAAADFGSAMSILPENFQGPMPFELADDAGFRDITGAWMDGNIGFGDAMSSYGDWIGDSVSGMVDSFTGAGAEATDLGSALSSASGSFSAFGSDGDNGGFVPFDHDPGALSGGSALANQVEQVVWSGDGMGFNGGNMSLYGGAMGGGMMGGAPGGGLGDMLGMDGGGPQQFAQTLTMGSTQLQTAMTQFATQFQAAATQVVTAMQAAATQIQTAGAVGGIGGIGLASGGMVVGAGTGTSDSIPAMLSNGEFVMNSAGTRRYAPVLKAMNSGASQKEVAAVMSRVLNASPVRHLSKGGFAQEGYNPRLSNWMPDGFSGNLGNDGNNSQTNNINHYGGNSVMLKVAYNMRGQQDMGGKKFRRSAKQHARQLAAQLDKAKASI